MSDQEQNQKSEAALREEKILEFWKEQNIFEKSLKKDSPKGNYVFYDGPPFATGLMHYGHILGSTAKDVVGRYQTMQGFHVPRKWGWDCHGLPIENIVEKDLNIAGHKEIEKLGIDVFVEHARSKVLQYDKEWESSVERIGRWVDFKGGYKTMDNTFIESVWWAFSELNKKGLIYEGVRVLAYCARCETPIANSEIAMDNSYRDISDISVYVKFELVDEPGTFLIAWTTTPWTLPGNTAIALNKDVDYVKVKTDEEFFILAKDLVDQVLKDKTFTVVEEMKGEKLLGKNYKPVFPYYKDTDMPNKENIWKVWHADFVTTEKGTGIAHEAPAFGEEDADLAKIHNIPTIIHVDETGRFKPEVTDFAGLKVKPKDTIEDKDAHIRTDIEVIKYLQASGVFFAKEKIMHSYPHCMRCDTPIIYYALPSWFINIQKVKKEIIEKADTMNWVPSHLKEGRFKNIVDNAPDWNVSRNRYWASPLPVWKCESCKEKTFIGSLVDLKNKTRKSGNEYFVMRHGEAESNIKGGFHGTVSSRAENPDHLTDKGISQVRAAVEKLKQEKLTFDFFVVSPFVRTKETLEILKEGLNIKDEQVIFENRLGELDAGDFEGKPWDEYRLMFKNEKDRFLNPLHGGESLLDVKRRVGDVFYELEDKYKDKKILIISHGAPIWMLHAVLEGLSIDESIEMTGGLFRHSEVVESGDKNDSALFKNAEYRKADFVKIPHNKDYELDYHRPYIDEIKLVCDCNSEMERVPEVLDCWFESGSMPFAQDHFPMENKDWQKNNFPAGFVAEYIAQTRTWFYYTHVISTILFGHAPFYNVVTTGTVRAEDGQKISKSKKNYPDPWVFIDKYGVDALRIYLMASPLMKGEDANFSEKTVQEIASKIIGRLNNVVSFYELYRDPSLEKNKPTSENVLDKWTIARLNQLITEVTKGMDAYDMNEAARPLDAFVDDLSTWYLRRSRDRIKEGDKYAKQTLYYVLKTLSKLLAPFAPFTAEDIWLKLKDDNDLESVHLAEWPTSEEIDEGNISLMENAREIVSIFLKERQVRNIPVRQPLTSVTALVKKSLSLDYVEIIKEELNIKELKFIEDEKNTLISVEGDFSITPELKEEGNYRELARALQDMRKKMGLTPSDLVTITFKTDAIGENLVNKFESEIKKTVQVSGIDFAENDGDEIKIDQLVFKVKIAKI
jgi:isoleucyl-tRNA synthetase